MVASVLMSATKLTKRFGTNIVLDGIDFTLQEGTVHVLMGENGAGKSTFIKMIGGLLQPDGGEIRIRGNTVDLRNPAVAAAHGVRVVHQEIHLAPTLSVAENIFLNAMPRRSFGRIDRRKMRQDAAEMLSRLGVRLDVDAPVETLGVAQRQLVEIARALARKAEILILDEPTAALSAAEVDALLERLHLLKAQGLGLIYISHRMEEVRRIGDVVSVLRDGRLALSQPLAAVTDDALIEAMIGRSLETISTRAEGALGQTALHVQGLSCADVFEDVTFSIRAGEVVGVVGPLGSGFVDVGRVIHGVQPMSQGMISVFGKDHRPEPRRSMEAGIAFVPEDRKQTGLMLKSSVRRNASAGLLRELTKRAGFIAGGDECRKVDDIIHSLAINTPDASSPVTTLSGGNQQKVVLGRWLLRNPRILILAEPTRGVDVGAKEAIYALLRQIAGRGGAVLVLTSDLMEAALICDRVKVMRRGRIVDELPKQKLSVAALVNSLYGDGGAARVA
ncbi:sugar ABC transporter ATP-binding protein [Bradyrhizobium sp. dw_411]|uniref:sugar ABC transporter ATP-binding protein n=1 Tax=Bradyrhizobium sp. dw_411 TaxID=2720082 RepID=UPI001BCB1C50|nr:sugar ABC transporter ATP-binding protein [Bradyrhizobium sp. dw_411]